MGLEEEFIISHKVSALFLDCGLGKTVITLTAIWELLYDYFDIRKILITRIRFTCNGLGFFPGAFNSTNAIFLPGNKTILSGTPLSPGETNFTAMPPIFFASAQKIII